MSMSHDYLAQLPNEKSYVTLYRIFCGALTIAQMTYANIAQLDVARRAVASRRDMLVGRGRRRYDPRRQQEIDCLGAIYRHIVDRMLAKGWR